MRLWLAGCWDWKELTACHSLRPLRLIEFTVNSKNNNGNNIEMSSSGFRNLFSWLQADPNLETGQHERNDITQHKHWQCSHIVQSAGLGSNNDSFGITFILSLNFCLKSFINGGVRETGMLKEKSWQWASEKAMDYFEQKYHSGLNLHPSMGDRCFAGKQLVKPLRCRSSLLAFVSVTDCWVFMLHSLSWHFALYLPWYYIGIGFACNSWQALKIIYVPFHVMTRSALRTKGGQTYPWAWGYSLQSCPLPREARIQF